MVLHGGEIEWVVSAQYGIPMSNIVSFANTVSPFIPKEVRNLSKRLDQLSFYPPRDPRHLRSLVAKRERVEEKCVIFGSGSTELIHLFARVFCQGEIVLPVPTYSEYEEAVRTYGGRLKFVRPGAHFDLDLERILASITNQTKAVLICSPNNPTGKLFPKDTLVEIAKATARRGAILFVDQAYMCFAPPSKAYTLTELVESYPIFVLNSISKLFGVPSLRLGWGVASPKTISKMAHYRHPGTIGNLSVWAAEELLGDEAYQLRVNSFITKEREKFTRQLRETGMLTPLRSDCNFVLSRISKSGWNSTRLFETLSKKGVVIRDCASVRGLSDRFVRTTVRTPTDNKRLAQELVALRV